MRSHAKLSNQIRQVGRANYRSPIGWSSFILQAAGQRLEPAGHRAPSTAFVAEVAGMAEATHDRSPARRAACFFGRYHLGYCYCVPGIGHCHTELAVLPSLRKRGVVALFACSVLHFPDGRISTKMHESYLNPSTATLPGWLLITTIALQTST